jgi:hypothetical protein
MDTKTIGKAIASAGGTLDIADVIGSPGHVKGDFDTFQEFQAMQKPKRKNNRKKGDRAEYKTIKLMRENGYYCVRSAGSMGPFDVVAIPKDDGPTILIQSKSFKPVKYVKKDKTVSIYLPNYDAVIQAVKDFKVSWMCRKEIWKWKDRAREPEVLVIK